MIADSSNNETKEPYFVPNKGPVPQIEKEEGLPEGALDIEWIRERAKNERVWSDGLKWYERLHAHATMNSARRNVKCKRPYEPKDELDFVLEAAYCPQIDCFAEKGDPYVHLETALGKYKDVKIYKQPQHSWFRYIPVSQKKIKKSSSENPWQPQEKPEEKNQWETWRLLRNEVVVIPFKALPREHPILYSNGGIERKGNIHNVKLGIAADHSPQTNPGYSRTPSGAFYSI